MEDWVVIQEFPMYSVSDLGRIRQDNHDRIIQPRANQYGGVYVGLMSHGVQSVRSLPLLVATYFLERGLASFDTPINLDGDRWNCEAANLMWRPRSFARKYNRQFKEGPWVSILEPVRCKETRERFPTSFEAACRYGLLEHDVVAAIEHMTYAWPTYQTFELAE